MTEKTRYKRYLRLSQLMEILFVTLVEECLVTVAISVIIVSHKGAIFLDLCRIFNACVEAQNILIRPIIALREYTQTVKYINIPALSGMGKTIEWRDVDRLLQRTGK
ncbi:MAG: hypothetical protein O6928_02375 [Gammaproteobacteria bacterium]|nr:hypothetical protein [Gammaproteobacteria bacterium]